MGEAQRLYKPKGIFAWLWESGVHMAGRPSLAARAHARDTAGHTPARDAPARAHWPGARALA
jgi:hypothetical protein